jgi:hypothetical protein
LIPFSVAPNARQRVLSASVKGMSILFKYFFALSTPVSFRIFTAQTLELLARASFADIYP